MSAPSPKRVRQTGSFSPLSPPYYAGAKVSRPTFSPTTPSSPPMTSVSQQYATSHSSLTSNSQSHTVVSTPASSLSVPPNTSRHVDDEGDTQMDEIAMVPGNSKPQYDDAPSKTKAEDDVVMLESEDHRKSNHERNEEARYRADGEASHVGPLEGNAPTFFKICQYPHPLQRPHSSQNLITAYGLDDLAKSLRRYLPDDPYVKDVKLRKSYGGYLKSLMIAGRNEALEQTNAFWPRLTDYPAEEWHAHNVSGKPIGMTPELQGKIEAAMQMTRGPLPRPRQTSSKSKSSDDELGNKDVILKVRHLLDLGEKKPKPTGLPIPSGAAAVAAPAPRAVSGPAGIDPTRRPERVKKRSYNDDSFTGYGEGFEDDDPLGSTEPYRKRKKV